MEAKAVLKGVRVSPRKARLVVNLIRDKSVGEAINILNNLNNKTSRIAIKVLQSAVANAENNLELNVDNLYIKKTYVDEGPTLKRIKFGSRGHVDPIKKRTSHITIVVSELK